MPLIQSDQTKPNRRLRREKREVALMRRILLLATVAVMMATMLLVTAGPASATIHSLSCGDHARDGNPAEEELPPGITNDDESDVDDHDNGTNATQRQPIRSVDGNDTADENARDKKESHCERT